MISLHLPGQERTLYGTDHASAAAAQAAVRPGSHGQPRTTRAYTRDQCGRMLRLYLARVGYIHPEQMVAYGCGNQRVPRVDPLGPHGRAGLRDQREVQR